MRYVLAVTSQMSAPSESQCNVLVFILAVSSCRDVYAHSQLDWWFSGKLEFMLIQNVPTGKSDLTVDALKLHNELQTGSLELGRKDAAMEEEANEAVSERTSGTFLSGLSDCSNLTFRKVQRYWESNSAAHKEVLNATSRDILIRMNNVHYL